MFDIRHILLANFLLENIQPRKITAMICVLTARDSNSFHASTQTLKAPSD